MRRRIAVVVAAAAATLALMAGPASAHFNERAGKGVGVPAGVEPQGLGHVGMECGAEGGGVAVTPLVPLGLDCPAAR